MPIKDNHLASGSGGVLPVKPFPLIPEFVKGRSKAHREAWEGFEQNVDKWRKSLQFPTGDNISSSVSAVTNAGGGTVVTGQGQRGLQGVQGERGLIGITGQTGPAGGFVIRYLYSATPFNNYLTSVASGKFVSNFTNTDDTVFGLSVYDKYGVDMTSLLAQISDGDAVLVFDEDNPSNYMMTPEMSTTGFFNSNDWFFGAVGPIHNGIWVEGAKIAFCVSFKGDTGGAGGDDGLGYFCTSTTSLDIGTGSRTATLDPADNAYSVGARVRFTQASNINNWMEGQVTAKGVSSITFNSVLTNGSGTGIIDWNVNLAGEKGTPGNIGLTGNTGQNGSAGSDGSTILPGTTDPATPLGKNTDFYINTTSYDYFYKTGGLWVLQGNLRGPQGAQGIQGVAGPNGSTGGTGPAGPVGPHGPQGVQGDVGPEGRGYQATSPSSVQLGTGGNSFTLVPVGGSNIAYSVGARVRATHQTNVNNWIEGVVTSTFGNIINVLGDSFSGQIGTTISAWNINLAGEVGHAGATGAQGPAGATGATGPQGATGATGPQGQTGNTGATGPAGAAGAKGDTGAAGATGATGATGPAGTTGAQGPQGLQGLQGVQGNTGSTGPNGSDGPGYKCTSPDSLLIGFGTKTATSVTPASNAYTVGCRARFSNSVSAWMEGEVTAVSSGSITIAVDTKNGSGTYSSWNINLSGEPGVSGAGTFSGAKINLQNESVASTKVNAFQPGGLIYTFSDWFNQDTVEYDSSSYVTSSGGGDVVITIPSTGYYRITGFATWSLNLSDNVYTNSEGLTTTSGPGVASHYPSEIVIGCVPGVITGIQVKLNGISHLFPDDLDILLVSPTGKKIMLMSDCGGGADLVGVNLTFDDTVSAAAPALPDTTQITSGTYHTTDYGSPADVLPGPAPAGPYTQTLNDCLADNPNGTWSLYVYDDSAGDALTAMPSWSLVIKTGELGTSNYEATASVGIVRTRSGTASTLTRGASHMNQVSSDVFSTQVEYEGVLNAGDTLKLGRWFNAVGSGANIGGYHCNAWISIRSLGV